MEEERSGLRGGVCKGPDSGVTSACEGLATRWGQELGPARGKARWAAAGLGLRGLS